MTSFKIREALYAEADMMITKGKRMQGFKLKKDIMEISDESLEELARIIKKS